LGRFLFLFNFAASILAAFGLDILLQWLGRRVGGVTRRGSPLALRNGVALALTLTVAIQMLQFAPQVMRHQPNDPAVLMPETPLIEALPDRDSTRVLPLSLSESAVPPYGPILYGSTSMVFGLQSANGYETLLPWRMANIWRVGGQGLSTDYVSQTPFYWSYAPSFTTASTRFELLRRLGVTHVVTRPDIETDPAWTAEVVRRGGLEPLYQGADGRIYKVGNALPRAYLVSRCEVVETPLAALERFTDDAFDPVEAVLIESSYLPGGPSACPPPVAAPPGEAAGHAEIVERSLNTLTVSVDAARYSWLVVNESWDPGWTALLDGTPAAVLPGDYAFRTMPIPAGQHTLQLRYQPTSVLLGAIISSSSLVFLGLSFAVWAIARLRRRAPFALGI